MVVLEKQSSPRGALVTDLKYLTSASLLLFRIHTTTTPCSWLPSAVVSHFSRYGIVVQMDNSTSSPYRPFELRWAAFKVRLCLLSPQSSRVLLGLMNCKNPRHISACPDI